MINKVILMGRLTKDPELRYTNNKTPVCSFTIAVNNGYGEKQQTDFVNCLAWNKTAEFVTKYFTKGKYNRYRTNHNPKLGNTGRQESLCDRSCRKRSEFWRIKNVTTTEYTPNRRTTANARR